VYYNGRVINVILLENSCGVPGSVWHNSDDSYTIFIDASLSSSHQKKVFEHEMRHIFENDFEKYDVQEIECEAHGMSYK
jgi:hypothetical protein